MARVTSPRLRYNFGVNVHNIKPLPTYPDGLYEFWFDFYDDLFVPHSQEERTVWAREAKRRGRDVVYVRVSGDPRRFRATGTRGSVDISSLGEKLWRKLHE